jgi:hypothetical protein
LSPGELALATQFDGLAACVRAVVSELIKSTQDENLRQRLALAAAADIRSKTSAADLKAAQDLMLATVARTFEIPIGRIAGQ